LLTGWNDLAGRLQAAFLGGLHPRCLFVARARQGV
jgi:hypothetical protein